MKLSAILAPLIAAGVSGDVILATVKAFEDQQSDALERRRESDRKRQNEKRSRDVTLRHSDSSLMRDRDARGDVKQLNIDTNNEVRKDKSAAKPLSDVQAFKAELEPILSSERVDAIVDLRRKKKAPITPHAGKLLVKALKECPDVDAAADEMVLRNWTGIKPEWLTSRQTSSASSQGPPKRTIFDAIDDFIERNDHEQPGITIDHDGSHHPPNVHRLASTARRGS